jgi:uncharacterized LabA/DUF88 family protein
MRTSIYVDGFNLYHRALKETPFKWLDLKLLSQNLLQPHNQIVRIKYFTAMVSGTFDPNQPTRQKTYIRALQKHIPELEVYYGRFQGHEVKMPLSPLTKPFSYAYVHKTEEKGSDVNLAVHLLNDAWRDKYDCAVLISNDSDLAEPLRLVREQNKKCIGILSPIQDGPIAKDLQRHAHFVKRIRSGVLAASQLPLAIPDSTITKPASWAE